MSTTTKRPYADAPITIKRVRRGVSAHAYTAVATTMNRLVEKGLLTRRRSGLAYVFTATLSEQEFIDVQTGYALQALPVDVVARLLAERA